MATTEERLDALEARVNKHDLQYAVINTKLSAILWGLAVIGASLIGVLIKYVFNF